MSQITLLEQKTKFKLDSTTELTNKDFYSAISAGSWRFTTEYFESKIL